MAGRCAPAWCSSRVSWPSPCSAPVPRAATPIPSSRPPGCRKSRRSCTAGRRYTAAVPVSGGYRALVVLEFVLAAATFVGLRFVRAPYGRYLSKRWGPTVPARLGWLVMESPAVLVFAGVYALGPHRAQVVPVVLLVIWQSHYLYRAFGYPWTLRGSARMPVVIPLMAIAFNGLNGYINARWVSAFGD